MESAKYIAFLFMLLQEYENDEIETLLFSFRVFLSTPFFKKSRIIIIKAPALTA